MDYFVLSDNLYIKNDGEKFNYYNYKRKKLGYCTIVDKSKLIFSYSTLNLEAINLMSEILFFLGNKEKDVICLGNDNLISIGFINNIKSVESFKNEREQKYETINELYKKPYLVPWNLVEREHDITDLVKKYLETTSSILEIGSGYGKNLVLLDELKYKNVLGIEYSENALAISKKVVSNNILGDINNTDYSNEQFDGIIDIGCLHCVNKQNKGTAVKEILRILKSNGLIISRYFLTKNQKWVNNYPIKVDGFGNEYDEIIDMFKDFNIIHSSISNGCVYIVGRKK